MLCIISQDEWINTIESLREGAYPCACTLKKLEKHLINYLTSPLPQNRPQKMETIVKTVEALANEGMLFLSLQYLN